MNVHWVRLLNDLRRGGAAAVWHQGLELRCFCWQMGLGNSRKWNRNLDLMRKWFSRLFRIFSSFSVFQYLVTASVATNLNGLITWLNLLIWRLVVRAYPIFFEFLETRHLWLETVSKETRNGVCVLFYCSVMTIPYCLYCFSISRWSGEGGGLGVHFLIYLVLNFLTRSCLFTLNCQQFVIIIFRNL